MMNSDCCVFLSQLATRGPQVQQCLGLCLREQCDVTKKMISATICPSFCGKSLLSPLCSEDSEVLRAGK